MVPYGVSAGQRDLAEQIAITKVLGQVPCTLEALGMGILGSTDQETPCVEGCGKTSMP